MAEPYTSQIVMFAGNFAPRTWAYCDGQLLAISSNSALFSLLGTIYGGDGRTTFGIPDMRGRAAVHAGNGPGLSDRRLGAKTGTETNTMTQAQVASHNHSATGKIKVQSGAGDQKSPQGNYVAADSNNTELNFAGAATANQFMAAGAVTVSAGASATGGQPINNMGPVLAVRYVIQLFGIYPSRH